MMNLPIGHSGRSVYQSRRLEEGKAARRFVYVLIFAFFAISAAWIVFSSGYFDYTTIEMQGIASLNRGEVETEVDKALSDRPWRPWKKTNVLLLNAHQLGPILKERIFAEDVTVEKSWPNILRLIITERQRSVVIVSGDQYVNVDTSGVVTGEVEGELLKSAQDRIAAKILADHYGLPVIQMPTADPLAPGFQVASAKQVRVWLDFYKTLVNAGLKFYFIKVETPQAALARVVPEIKRDIYFDISQPWDPQIETYGGYIKTQPQLKDINEYIDIRVPGRVFTK